MLVNRRGFIRSLVAIPLGATGIPNLLTPNPFTNTWVYKPSPAQLKFLEDSLRLVCLYGLPYHVSSAGMGDWMGIKRV